MVKQFSISRLPHVWNMAGSDVVAPIRVSQFETRSRYTIDTKPQFLLSKIIGNEVQMGLVVRNGQKVMF